MLEKLRNRSSDESGFTLVELLVVMLILGILAAIAVPSFFNQRDKATDAEAKAAVRTSQTAMETFATDNNGSYATADVTALEAIEPTLTDADLSLEATVDTYTVTATSDNDTEGTDAMKFSITRTETGTTTLDCVVEGKDGCPTDGNWG